MIMIIGGAYQGKLAYAKETFPDVRWTDGEQCEKEAIFQYRGIFHFHKYIERLLSEGEDISSYNSASIYHNLGFCS